MTCTNQPSTASISGISKPDLNNSERKKTAVNIDYENFAVYLSEFEWESGLMFVNTLNIDCY